MQLLNSLSISTLLVLGALANPLSSVNSDVYDISESTRLQTRTTQEQQNYQVLKAAAGHHKLDTGKQYAFVLKWALKHSDGLDDLNRLTSEIGGFHVGLIVGTIKGKDSFDGEYYDILFPKGFKVTQQNMNTAPVERWQHELKLSSRSTKTVIYRGPIPKVNEDHILDLGMKPLFKWLTNLLTNIANR